MCHIRFIPLMISVFFITACNVGDESFSAGGVSLGGSGTGCGEQTLPPGGARPPEKEIIFEEPDENWVFKVIYPERVEQNCGVIQRSLQFIDQVTRQPIKGEQNLPEDNKVILQVTVQNLSQQPVYEFVDNCQPITVMNIDSSEITVNLPASCAGEESLQVYKPQQTKIFQYAIPIETYYNYTWAIDYQSQYASTTLAEKSFRIQCPAVQAIINVDLFEMITEQDDTVDLEADHIQDEDNILVQPALQFFMQ